MRKNFFIHIILLSLAIFFLTKIPKYENTLLQLNENTKIERDYPIYNDDTALFYLKSTNLKYIIYVKELKKSGNIWVGNAYSYKEAYEKNSGFKWLEDDSKSFNPEYNREQKEIEYNKSIFESVEVKIIRPCEHNFYVNTIMDVVPISTKVIGRLGEGITHTLTGVYMLLTGANTEGKQMHEFGSSEGILQEQLVLNKAGSPAVDDYLIHIDVIIKPDAEFNRELAFSIFELSDVYLQNIREVMKVLSGRDADEVHEFYNKQNPGKPKVALVKEVAGQGMMYDNQLFPIEPSGIDKGISIIDMNNMPVLLTPNEYRDGAIRAMV